MRIAVNTRLLLKDRLEGIGRFTLELISRIAIAHPEHDFIFIFDRKFDEKFIFSKNVQAVVVGPQARHPILFIVWFEISVRYILKKYKADIFISPDGFLSLSSKITAIAVMHDLNFEHNPEDIPFLVRVYYKFFFPRFAAKAQKIVTVSDFSRQDIIKIYSQIPSKVDVVYNGVNLIYSPLEAIEKQQVRDKYTQGNEYFIFVGALHQRKNLVNLFLAFDKYKSNSGNSVKLMIVGNKMWWTKQIENTYNSLSFKEDVVFHNHMSTSELRQVYGSAIALTYVSLFEGFGIPIIESFACGTPVITSNITSMPEVAAQAAILVNPLNIDEISEAMHNVETDKILRDKLIELGLERAKYFSWDDSAVKLWKIICEINS